MVSGSYYPVIWTLHHGVKKDRGQKCKDGRSCLPWPPTVWPWKGHVRHHKDQKRERTDGDAKEGETGVSMFCPRRHIGLCQMVFHKFYFIKHEFVILLAPPYTKIQLFLCWGEILKTQLAYYLNILWEFSDRYNGSLSLPRCLSSATAANEDCPCEETASLSVFSPYFPGNKGSEVALARSWNFTGVFLMLLLLQV